MQYVSLSDPKTFEEQFRSNKELEAGQLPLQVEQPALVPGLHELPSLPVPLLPMAMTFCR